MKWFLYAISSILLFANPASSQQFLDASSGSVSAVQKDAILQATIGFLYDPFSIEYIRLRAVGTSHVCGLMNGKNLQGAYIGFRKFVVDVDNKVIVIDPNYDQSEHKSDSASEKLAGLNAELEFLQEIKKECGGETMP